MTPASADLARGVRLVAVERAVSTRCRRCATRRSPAARGRPPSTDQPHRRRTPWTCGWCPRSVSTERGPRPRDAGDDVDPVALPAVSATIMTSGCAEPVAGKPETDSCDEEVVREQRGEQHDEPTHGDHHERRRRAPCRCTTSPSGTHSALRWPVRARVDGTRSRGHADPTQRLGLTLVGTRLAATSGSVAARTRSPAPVHCGPESRRADRRADPRRQPRWRHPHGIPAGARDP